MGNTNFCCAPEEQDEDDYSQVQKQFQKDQQFLDQNEVQRKQYQVDQIRVSHSGMNDHKKISLNHFELLKVIGRGSFGLVMLVRKKLDNKCYAMKILRKNRIDSKNKYKHTLNERQILESANHHYVVNLRYAFQTDSKLYFIMDFINGGELFKILRRQGAFDEYKAKFYIAEIICALEYLHSKNIIFRDLKPENVLIDSQGHVKVTDFGLAKKLNEDDKAVTICGTPEYLSPEIIQKKPYGRQIDYWTIGILLYELLTLRTPFRARQKQEIFENVLQKEVILKDYFSDEAKDIILRLLNKDPSKRLGSNNGFDEIKKHPFFNDLDWKKLSQKKLTPPWKPDSQSIRELKYFDQNLLQLDPYARDSQDSSDNDDNLKFDGFTLDPSKLRTFALPSNKKSQITQARSQTGLQKEQDLLMVNKPKLNNFDESKSQTNSPKNSQIQGDDQKAKTAFHKPVKVPTQSKEQIQKQQADQLVEDQIYE